MLKLTWQKTLDLWPLYRSTSIRWHLQLRTGGVSFLLSARPCNKALIPNIRNVNSREIAFPGQESQFPGIDRDSISPEYVPITGAIRVGSPAGVWRGRRKGRSPTSRRCRAPSPRANDRSTAGSAAPETSHNDQGSAIREVQWPIGPRTTGRGIDYYDIKQCDSHEAIRPYSPPSRYRLMNRVWAGESGELCDSAWIRLCSERTWAPAANDKHTNCTTWPWVNFHFNTCIYWTVVHTLQYFLVRLLAIFQTKQM